MFVFGLHLISGPGLGKRGRYQSLYPLANFLSEGLITGYFYTSLFTIIGGALYDATNGNWRHYCPLKLSRFALQLKNQPTCQHLSSFKLLKIWFNIIICCLKDIQCLIRLRHVLKTLINVSGTCGRDIQTKTFKLGFIQGLQEISKSTSYPCTDLGKRSTTFMRWRLGAGRLYTGTFRHLDF